MHRSGPVLRVAANFAGRRPPPLTRTAFNVMPLPHPPLTLSQHHYGSPHLSADPRLSVADRRLGVANQRPRVADQRPGVWEHLARSISPFPIRPPHRPTSTSRQSFRPCASPLLSRHPPVSCPSC